MFIKPFLFISLFLSTNYLFAQIDSVQYYVEEGIKYHDAGNYDEAIVRYDHANRIKPGFVASYEKSYSLFLAKRYDECIALCRQIIQDYKGNPSLKDVYVNYGSAFDEKGKPEEALTAYDEGIKAFPGFHLLWYNKGLTLFKNGKDNEAEVQFQKSLEIQPFHPSSNNALGILLKSKNKVPALLADVTFLLTEMKGPRAEECIKRVEEIFTSNVKKGEKGNVTITINSDLLDMKKGGENNFSMVEITMSLLSGLDEDSLYKNETSPERLKRKLEVVASSLKEGKKNKGFYWTHYAPFFAEMRQKELIDVVANLCYYSIGDEDVKKWLELNDEKVKTFYSWMKNYKWKN